MEEEEASPIISRDEATDKSWMFCPISGSLLTISSLGATCSMSGYTKTLKGAIRVSG